MTLIDQTLTFRQAIQLLHERIESLEEINRELKISASIDLSLRDYFAGCIMQGMIAGGMLTISKDFDASHCYAIADSLISARTRKSS